MFKLITSSLLAALLAGCAGTPPSDQLGGRNAKDERARESASWLEWARANNGGP